MATSPSDSADDETPSKLMSGMFPSSPIRQSAAACSLLSSAAASPHLRLPTSTTLPAFPGFPPSFLRYANKSENYVRVFDDYVRKRICLQVFILFTFVYFCIKGPAHEHDMPRKAHENW